MQGAFCFSIDYVFPKRNLGLYDFCNTIFDFNFYFAN